MKKRLYDIKDCDDKSIVWETKRQKDILDILDEFLECAKKFGWNYAFEDDSFFIEYTNGKTYEAMQFEESGIYKKKCIKRIIYSNPNDTIVFGKYNANEYGIVF